MAWPISCSFIRIWRFLSCLLNAQVVDWDDNFRLFFTTKLANPHYSPEVMGKTMIVNYGVTMDGLANQLLNVVVAHERADLEESYAALVTEMSESALLLVRTVITCSASAYDATWRCVCIPVHAHETLWRDFMQGGIDRELSVTYNQLL